MSKMHVWMALGCCWLVWATLASAQGKPKAGLWEVSTTMQMDGAGMPQMPRNMPQMPQNIQLPPGVKLPPGMQMPQMPGGAGGGNAHTSQICVTQAMIDRYGGPSGAPQNRSSSCQLTDITKKTDGMTAKVSCTGAMTGTGTVDAVFSDGGNTTNSTVHIQGTMQMGQSSRPVNMTVQSTSVYKGADCGSVKPLEAAAN